MDTIAKMLGRRKAALLAVVVALTLLCGSTALAGTGVGGVFNLGKTNAVNAITKLAGSVPGASLVVDNNSTNSAATALDLQVEPGKAPLKVNSQAKVANLNADKVDGMDSTALGSRANMTTAVLDSTIPTDAGAYGGPAQTVATAPLSVAGNAEQLVRLDGYLELNDSMGPEDGCPCEFSMLIVDTTTNTVVGQATQTFYGTNTDTSNWAMSQPVLETQAAPGSHVYQLRVKVLDRDAIVDGVVFSASKARLIAQTIPFSN
jgi:hypothetical protein